MHGGGCRLWGPGCGANRCSGATPTMPVEGVIDRRQRNAENPRRPNRGTLRRKRWPHRSHCATPGTLIAGQPGDRFTLRVDFHDCRRHLPILSLKRAASGTVDIPRLSAWTLRTSCCRPQFSSLYDAWRSITVRDTQPGGVFGVHRAGRRSARVGQQEIRPGCRFLFAPDHLALLQSWPRRKQMGNLGWHRQRSLRPGSGAFPSTSDEGFGAVRLGIDSQVRRACRTCNLVRTGIRRLLGR